ncbi:MAG: prepilin peptidase [Bacilli bacterium]
MDEIKIIYAVFIFIFSLCIGSFINVVIYRIPNHMSLVSPSSHCTKCGHKLAWYDNIPILSYIILGGKCRYCKEKISPQYLIVELFTAVIATSVFIYFGISFNALIGILLVYFLIPLTIIDAKYQIIPDSINIGLLVIGVIGFIVNIPLYDGIITINWLSKIIGFAVAILISCLFAFSSKLLKKELIGGGDLKLLLSVSLIVGWQQLLLIIFLSSLLVLIIGLPFGQKINKFRENPKQIPFGPYLSIIILIVFMFGPQIIEWYFGLFLV